MAKNTSSSAFRKIDVDQYNEDNFKDDEQENQQLSGIDEGAINQLLLQQKNVDALKICLENAPLLSKNQQLKDQALQITLRVMLSIKPSQIDTCLDTLDPDTTDTLMKYIYRGFEFPSDGSSGHLLQWHEKVFSKSGVGSIVRVLTDTARA
ncbi:CLUMA_CG007837, isoform A [Clunio marinus]|uniref:Actin-related protein 2/3 complex subunit 5 n=1 Tax=Clunio marinus TaxID=568069 RepID=A0A1J1I3H7_9DIPT|nr:CLUMA_CG007837, isoform A [Clunio marinus]